MTQILKPLSAFFGKAHRNNAPQKIPNRHLAKVCSQFIDKHQQKIKLYIKDTKKQPLI
jgi:hypothetical protein